MKRYEGLFILNNAAKEDGVKETIDKISGEITTAGGKIEAVQKLDKRIFTRVADKKHTSGFYVNFIFDAPPAAIATLRSKFTHNEEIFRVLFHLGTVVPVAAAK
ncbi:MAG: 30S ribosomal protein S6 [Verrucomicrobia bacterium]|nr:30S ribosomal protein S6 [Verrucomicrobiota bacterium]